MILNKLLPQVKAFGFELEDLGRGSYAVNAVPAGLDGLNPVSLIRDMVEAAKESGVSAIDEINKSLALSMARAAAIPVGQVLGNDEMEGLVNNLFGCSNVNYTPDGKMCCAFCNSGKSSNSWDKRAKKLAIFVFLEKSYFFQKKEDLKILLTLPSYSIK